MHGQHGDAVIVGEPPDHLDVLADRVGRDQDLDPVITETCGDLERVRRPIRNDRGRGQRDEGPGGLDGAAQRDSFTQVARALQAARDAPAWSAYAAREARYAAREDRLLTTVIFAAYLAYPGCYAAAWIAGRILRSVAPGRYRAGMGKSSTGPVFRCAECGWRTTRWSGRCAECQAWGTVEE